MTDLARIGLPLQVIGFGIMPYGLIARNLPTIWIGFFVHFVGDALFFIQMKRQKCI
jgi:hypothetical protein